MPSGERGAETRPLERPSCTPTMIPVLHAADNTASFRLDALDTGARLSRSAMREPGILEDQPELVVEQLALKLERGGGVVIALPVPIVV